jgi:hypothetical protein
MELIKSISILKLFLEAVISSVFALAISEGGKFIS